MPFSLHRSRYLNCTRHKDDEAEFVVTLISDAEPSDV